PAWRTAKSAEEAPSRTASTHARGRQGEVEAPADQQLLLLLRSADPCEQRQRVQQQPHHVHCCGCSSFVKVPLVQRRAGDFQYNTRKCSGIRISRDLHVYFICQDCSFLTKWFLNAIFPHSNLKKKPYFIISCSISLPLALSLSSGKALS